MPITKYAGFDNDSIRIPHMPKIEGESGINVQTTYVFNTVFYKIGDQWFKESFTVTTAGDSACAKKLLIGAIFKKRTITEKDQRNLKHSFHVTVQDGQLNVTLGQDNQGAPDTQVYALAELDSNKTESFIDEGSMTRLERLRGRVRALEANYLDLRHDMALVSREHNLLELNDQRAENLRLIAQNGPNIDQLMVRNQGLEVQISQLSGGFKCYVPDRITELFIEPDADQILRKVNSQIPKIEELGAALAETAPFSQRDAQLRDELASGAIVQEIEVINAERRGWVFSIEGRGRSISDLEKMTQELSDKHATVEQRALSIKNATN